jgi:hypothetical protein
VGHTRQKKRPRYQAASGSRRISWVQYDERQCPQTAAGEADVSFESFPAVRLVSGAAGQPQ